MTASTAPYHGNAMFTFGIYRSVLFYLWDPLRCRRLVSWGEVEILPPTFDFLLDARKGELHKLNINKTAVENSSFSNQSVTQTFQIHIRNKNISKEIDKLHQGETRNLVGDEK